MFPPVFQIISTPEVRALVSDRIYEFDDAPEGVVKPYIAFSMVGNDPIVNLSSAPTSEHFPMQIDAYAGPGDDAAQQVVDLAVAIRRALDARLIPNRVVVSGREPDTKLYRIAIEAAFLIAR